MVCVSVHDHVNAGPYTALDLVSASPSALLDLVSCHLLLYIPGFLLAFRDFLVLLFIVLEVMRLQMCTNQPTLHGF